MSQIILFKNITIPLCKGLKLFLEIPATLLHFVFIKLKVVLHLWFSFVSPRIPQKLIKESFHSYYLTTKHSLKLWNCLNSFELKNYRTLLPFSKNLSFWKRILWQNDFKKCPHELKLMRKRIEK